MSFVHPSPEAEALAVKVATGAQYVGAATATVFGLTPAEWSVVGIIVGIVVGLAGLGANVWFRWQHLKVARAKAGMESRPGDLE